MACWTRDSHCAIDGHMEAKMDPRRKSGLSNRSPSLGKMAVVPARISAAENRINQIRVKVSVRCLFIPP